MPTSKSILFISSRSDIGGGSKHLNDLLEYLHSNNSEYDIYVAAPLEEPFGPFYKKYSKQFIEIPKRGITITSILELLFFIRKYKIDIIHSHGRGAGMYSRPLKLLTLLLFYKLQVIHTFHGIHQGSNLAGILSIRCFSEGTGLKNFFRFSLRRSILS